MSSSKRFVDGKSSGKSPEKSNFVNTCNLLSQYLKEKGKLKDLSHGITGQLANITKSEASHTTSATQKKLVNTIEDLNLPPTQEKTSMASSSISPEDPTNKASTSPEEMQPKSAQMTIFYDGKIWVFNGLAADKAREVAIFARAAAAVASSSSAAPLNPPSNLGKFDEHVLPQHDANDSVIPIARRASLHRFLGKRKERVVTRGPNQVQDAPASSSKNDEEIDLNL